MRIVYLSYERGLELAEKGHGIMHVDANTIEEQGLEETVKAICAFEPNLILEREFNDVKAIYTALHEKLKAECPKAIRAMWFIDTHVSHDRHLEYAKNFDVVFLAISKFVPKFKELLGEERAFWLPLCWPYRSDAIHRNYSLIDCPVSFVGRWKELEKWFPERAWYIGKLKERLGPNFYAVTDYQNMLSIVKRSKVSFNYCIAGDLNFRVFEVLGCGTELVTNDVPDLHKIHGLAEKLTIYKDIDDLLEYIYRLLGNDPTVSHNTLQTQQWVKERHCLVNRHLQLLDMVEGRGQISF